MAAETLPICPECRMPVDLEEDNGAGWHPECATAAAEFAEYEQSLSAEED